MRNRKDFYDDKLKVKKSHLLDTLCSNWSMYMDLAVSCVLDILVIDNHNFREVSKYSRWGIQKEMMHLLL